MLGTSALLPTPERSLTSMLISSNGHSILVDCGEGTQTAARRAGVSLMKTEMIALTHFHGDHIFGLPGLMQTMSVMGRTEELLIVGPNGIEKELAPIMALTGKTAYPVILREFTDGMLTCGEIKIQTFATNHKVISQGYVFTLDRNPEFLPNKAKELGIPVKFWGELQKGMDVIDGDRIYKSADVTGERRNGLKIVVSGDTAECDNLTEAVSEADLFVCEATYGEDDDKELAREYGHMTFRDACRTAKNGNAKRLLLTHFSQRIKDAEECLTEVMDEFPNTECATDGMKIELRFQKAGH